MIDHIGLAVTDIARSRAFYEAALKPLGYAVVAEEKNTVGGTAVMFGVAGEIDFVIADKEQPGEGNHVAFRTRTRAEVDAFHKAALATSGKENGEPGLRPQYGAAYYAAFVIDPDGFNVEAVCHAAE